MATQVVKIALDASDLTANAKAMLQSLSQQQKGVLDLAKVMEKFNSSGQPIRQTLQGIAADGSAFEVTLKKVGAAWELHNAKTQAAASGYKAAAAAAAQATAALRANAAAAAGDIIRQGPAFKSGFGNLSPEAMNAVEAAIRRVQRAIEGGSVDLARFNQLYTALLNDPKANLGNLTAGEAKVVAALRNINTEFDNLGKAGAKSGEKIGISFEGIVRLIETQLIKRAFKAFITAVASGVEEAAKLSIAIAKIQAISGDAAESTIRWRNEVAKLSSAYAITQDEVAKGAYEAYQAGAKNAVEATILLNNALKLTTVTTLTTSESIQALAQITEAYGDSVGNSTKYTETFFNVFSKSRATPQQFASEMARLATSGAGVGVSFNETSAAVTTLTAKGIKFSDAVGLINSVLVELEHPSKDLRAEFEKLGISTGQELLQLKGFGGVLDFLAAQAKAGNKNLGQLAEGFQSMQRRVNVAGNAFDGYNVALGKLNNSNDTLEKGVERVGDTIGIKFQTQLNDVKEYFVNEWSTKVLKVITGTTDNVISLTEAVKLAFPALEAAAGAFISVQAVALISRSLVSLQAAWYGVAAAEGTAAAAAKSAVASAAPLIAAFAAGAFIENTFDDQIVKLMGHVQALGDVQQAAIDKEEARQTDWAKRFEKINKARETQENNLVQAVKDGYDEKYKVILTYEANVVKAFNSIRDAEIKDLQEVNEAVKASSIGLTDSIKANIKDLEGQATSAKSEIEKSSKAITDLQKHAADTFFQNKLKYAEQGQVLGSQGPIVDDQRDTLIRNRIASLTAEAKKFAATGTKDGIEEARKLYGEIEKYQAEVFDNETNLRKKAFDLEVKQGKATPTGRDPVTGQLRYEFTVKTAEFEEKINALTKERIGLEEAFQAKEAAIQAEKSAAAEKEKQRLKTVSDLLSKAASFSVYNTAGNVKPQYVNDPTKAVSDLNFIETQLKSHTDVTEQNFQIFADLEKKKVAVVKEVQSQILALEASRAEEDTTRNAKKVKEDVDSAKKDIDEAKINIQKKKDAFAASAAAIRDLVLVENRAGAAFLFPSPAQVEQHALFEDAKKAEANLDKATLAFKALQEGGGTAGQISAAADNLKNLTDIYSKATASFLKAKAGVGPEQLQVSGHPEFGTAKDQLDSLKFAALGIKNSADEANAATDKIAAAKEKVDDLDTTIKALPNDFKDIGIESKSMAEIVNDSFKQMGTNPNLDQLLNKVSQLRENLGSIRAGLPTPKANIPDIAPGNMMGKVKHFGAGGFTDFIPRGSDYLPAMLAKGESVVNKDATDQWAPLIQAMNAGSLSKKSDGGSHPSFGDINITVNGGNTSDQTIKNIATGLRRSLRRGLITLE